MPTPRAFAATRPVAAAVLAACAAVVACSSSDDAPPERTGQACSNADQCYPGVDRSALRGDVQCLTRVPNGYCTHLCDKDDDCCAAEGECRTGFRQVCAPFESTGQRMCFLSCEDTDVAAADAGTTDTTAYCQANASSAFRCRSSGGGSQNRKVCVP
jgi:hypothetical protein